MAQQILQLIECINFEVFGWEEAKSKERSVPSLCIFLLSFLLLFVMSKEAIHGHSGKFGIYRTHNHSVYSFL